jgi:hypothetical protein
VKQLTLDQFVMQFSPAMQVRLRDHASRPDTQVLVAWDNAGKLSASAYTAVPDEWPEGTVSVYSKTPLPAHAQDAVAKSKTMQAVALVEQGMTAYAAAKQVGINASAVTRALQRREDKTICPCCGQIVREGFKVNRAVLKTPSRGPASS